MNIKIEREACGYGWVAVDDDSYDGPGSPLGHGKTETDAYQELLLQLFDRGAADGPHGVEFLALLRAEFEGEEWLPAAEPDWDLMREANDERLERLRGLED